MVVHANTARYNYGPLFFMLLGFLYKTASYLPRSILFFRVFIVSILTLTDILIAKIISRKAGNLWGIVFFLNPISLIITGYHNQFDNIALLAGTYGILCIEKTSCESEIKCSDIYGTALITLSLITKHILWALPLYFLFNTKINTRKKFLYAFVPPVIFILSFMPYISEGREGILNNVFLYKSFNNFPLIALNVINKLGISIPFQKSICFPIFGLLMLLSAYIFRNENIFDSFMLYTISLVCFSSAIANQYLAIPCMALIILFREKSALYFVLGGICLSCHLDGLHIPLYIQEHFGINLNLVTMLFGRGAIYILLSWCLLYYLVQYAKKRHGL